MSIILQALVILFVVLVTVLTAPLWLTVEAVLGLWRIKRVLAGEEP